MLVPQLASCNRGILYRSPCQHPMLLSTAWRGLEGPSRRVCCRMISSSVAVRSQGPYAASGNSDSSAPSSTTGPPPQQPAEGAQQTPPQQTEPAAAAAAAAPAAAAVPGRGGRAPRTGRPRSPTPPRLMPARRGRPTSLPNRLPPPQQQQQQPPRVAQQGPPPGTSQPWVHGAGAPAPRRPSQSLQPQQQPPATAGGSAHLQPWATAQTQVAGDAVPGGSQPQLPPAPKPQQQQQQQQQVRPPPVRARPRGPGSQSAAQPSPGPRAQPWAPQPPAAQQQQQQQQQQQRPPGPATAADWQQQGFQQQQQAGPQLTFPPGWDPRNPPPQQQQQPPGRSLGRGFPPRRRPGVLTHINPSSLTSSSSSSSTGPVRRGGPRMDYAGFLELPTWKLYFGGGSPGGESAVDRNWVPWRDNTPAPGALQEEYQQQRAAMAAEHDFLYATASIAPQEAQQLEAEYLLDRAGSPGAGAAEQVAPGADDEPPEELLVYAQDGTNPASSVQAGAAGVAASSGGTTGSSGTDSDGQADDSRSTSPSSSTSSSSSIDLTGSPSTREWAWFVECALAQEEDLTGEGFEQRSQEWLALRHNRLTASSLCNVLCWFGFGASNAVQLWKEKVGLEKPPPANKAMKYGTNHEAAAKAAYQGLHPEHQVEEVTFAVWGPHPAHNWLGASPDGFVTEVTTGEHGLLEIKVPYGLSPQAEKKKERAIDYYYMPQVQVQMAMAGVEWANVYYWSEQQGSLCARVPRDREYFRLLWQVLADFWWLHVMPARLALQRRAFKEGRALTPEEQEQEAAPFQPHRKHAFSEALRRRSIQMLREAEERSLQEWDEQATAAAVQTAAGIAQSTADGTGGV